MPKRPTPTAPIPMQKVPMVRSISSLSISLRARSSCRRISSSVSSIVRSSLSMRALVLAMLRRDISNMSRTSPVDRTSDSASAADRCCQSVDLRESWQPLSLPRRVGTWRSPSPACAPGGECRPPSPGAGTPTLPTPWSPGPGDGSWSAAASPLPSRSEFHVAPRPEPHAPPPASGSILRRRSSATTSTPKPEMPASATSSSRSVRVVAWRSRMRMSTEASCPLTARTSSMLCMLT
mmetsp:Transcript_10252/g.27892  ORF Transcript_10252/g.27892 Transcript_10252/m.27892 type:complete len:236 (+) Transcript_10252:268-975(+)